MVAVQRLLQGVLDPVSDGRYRIQGSVWDDRSNTSWDSELGWEVSLDLTLKPGGILSFDGAVQKEFRLPSAARYIEPGDEWQIGWPEPLLLVIRSGAIRYGYGCLFHFRKRLELDKSAALEQVSIQPRTQDSSVIQGFEFAQGPHVERFELQPGEVWKHEEFELKVEHAEEVRGVTGATHWYKMELRT